MGTIKLRRGARSGGSGRGARGGAERAPPRGRGAGWEAGAQAQGCRVPAVSAPPPAFACSWPSSRNDQRLFGNSGPTRSALSHVRPSPAPHEGGHGDGGTAHRVAVGRPLGTASLWKAGPVGSHATESIGLEEPTFAGCTTRGEAYSASLLVADLGRAGTTGSCLRTRVSCRLEAQCHLPGPGHGCWPCARVELNAQQSPSRQSTGRLGNPGC